MAIIILNDIFETIAINADGWMDGWQCSISISPKPLKIFNQEIYSFTTLATSIGIKIILKELNLVYKNRI